MSFALFFFFVLSFLFKMQRSIIERMIELFELKRLLWDKKILSNTTHKANAYKEIAEVLVKEFNDKSITEISVKSKLTHLRDSWKRRYKELKKTVTGQPVKTPDSVRTEQAERV